MGLEKHLSEKIKSFFKEKNQYLNSLKSVNHFLEAYCGIINFFTKEEELNDIQNIINTDFDTVEVPNRRAYGDFQTNENLSFKVINSIQNTGFSPEFILEPTCGKGIFLVNSLKSFREVKKLIGIEIYYPYILETKFKILELFIEQQNQCKPKIEIIHADIFQSAIPHIKKLFNLNLKIPCNNAINLLHRRTLNSVENRFNRLPKFNFSSKITF